MIRPLSLRLRLILWFTFIFTLLIFLSDYVTYTALERIIIAELDSGLVSTMAFESAAYRKGAAPNLEAIVAPPGQSPRLIPQFIQILDPSGSVLSQAGLAESNAILDDAQLRAALAGEVVTADGQLRSTAIRLAAAKDERDGRPFIVVVGTSTTAVNHTTARIAAILVVIDLMTVLATVGGGYLIIGRALKPIDHIAERSHQIGAGNLHQRLEYIDSSAEMVRLTRVLNQMFDKLQALFESQRQFVQDASHEIRSPLAALRCRLEVALRQNRDADQYRRVIEGAMQDAVRMTGLAEDLFLLARADSNNLSMEIREVPLSEVIQSVHDQLKPMAEQNDIAFELEARPASVVYADRARIAQAFRNIAENALKYTPKGGRVSISMQDEGEYVRTDIVDTGIGIPLDEQANIFRRFYRVDHARSRSDGGTGLGLSICDQIIRAHQGRIEVDSTPGRGTRFSVYLASATSLLEK